MIAAGNLRKMKSQLDDQIRYRLMLSDDVDMNELVGHQLTLNWMGTINCQKCGKITRKSFGEGFCYNCFVSAPEAAECIIRPELCRAHLGEGRDPKWEEEHHNRPHVVYLAASSAVKVGITRMEQVPTRWIDQGATSAIKLAVTKNRYEAGVLEVALKDIFTDKTHWQKMLKNEIDPTIDLIEEKWSLEEHLPMDLIDQFTEDDQITELHYPVLRYPSIVKSLTFDKAPKISAKLEGIKGQYLIFEGGHVLNIRKHTGYNVEVEY